MMELHSIEQDGNHVGWFLHGVEGFSLICDGVAVNAYLCEPDFELSGSAIKRVCEAVNEWLQERNTMKGLEILGRDRRYVHWRYLGKDGNSYLEDGKAIDVYGDTSILTPGVTTQIIKAVNHWLQEQP